MRAEVPNLADYGISEEYGFLPDRLPLRRLPDPYYNQWESVIDNLQALVLTKKIRSTIGRMAVLSTDGLIEEAEWKRAYMILGFMAHAHIWNGDQPSDRLPPSISVPYLAISAHLDIAPVATYAAVCLWNWKPLFPTEELDLSNLSTLYTFTGSLDESWFYLVSVAIEARGGPIMSLMIDAIKAARDDNANAVARALDQFTDILVDLENILMRMYENCDPHIFFYHIRPFLSGSRNMEQAGLPHGVIYDTGSDNDVYQKWSGGSNAQSSLIQFFDIVLGIVHRPTGDKKEAGEDKKQGTVPAPSHNFIEDMRNYMPGEHRKFLEHTQLVANIRPFVESKVQDSDVRRAYDACCHQLRDFRSSHMKIVTRYVTLKSKEKTKWTRDEQNRKDLKNIATASQEAAMGDGDGRETNLKGTGGTNLIQFLKQARDETGEPALMKPLKWKRNAIGTRRPDEEVEDKTMEKEFSGVAEVNGLAGLWTDEVNGGGGLCHH